MTAQAAATHPTSPSASPLRFRTAEEIDDSLRAAGVDLERRYGGWDRRNFAGQDDEIVTMARRPA